MLLLKHVKQLIFACQEIVESSINNNYSIIIIADHGNSDVMKNNDGSPNTAHTTNPVPIIVIDSKTDKVNDGILADIAPTILNIMDIDIPEKMSGKNFNMKNLIKLTLLFILFIGCNKNNKRN